MRGKPALPTIFQIMPAALGGPTRRKVCWFNRGTVGRPPWNWRGLIAGVRKRRPNRMPSTPGGPVMDQPLSPELLRKMNAYWRAANYLSVGQIYLYDNPLLKRPLTLADVKHMLLGHWGTTPGQNFIYVHLNRVIKKYNLDMIYVSG